MRKKKTKFYFVGAYESSNRLCRYTRTRPRNETKLGKCVIIIYIKESVYVFIDSKLYGKVAFVWQTLAHVQKSRLVLVYSDG